MTDEEKNKVEGSVEATLESLKWLGADWDDFVTQSERLDEYRNYANQLLEKGHAREEEGAVRFITPNEGTTKWHDLIGDKDISFENSDIEDFIILKKDGYPTYHLANVIDDHLMGISHVIRGEDWIPSAPKHLMLYEAFGWTPPQFAHVPNVMGTDGKKLSKRRGAKSVLDFKNEGYLSEALLNYLMLLGWSPKNDREVLSRDEIEKEFSLERVNSAPAIFDERKLLWMNGEYIRRTPISNLKSQILEINPELGDLDKELIDKLLVPAQTRMKKLIEFKDYVLPFINPVTTKSPLLHFVRLCQRLSHFVCAGHVTPPLFRFFGLGTVVRRFPF
jgi:glutamyl-tRNA synthetase